MKVTFSAELPVLFFPDQLDDDRQTRPTLQWIRDTTDGHNGRIRAFVAIDGSGVEFHHQCGAKAIVSLDDVFRQAIKSTFGSLHLDVTIPEQEQGR
nr:hypothetical protein [uncultured Cohaesibacter sp.]